MRETFFLIFKIYFLDIKNLFYVCLTKQLKQILKRIKNKNELK